MEQRGPLVGASGPKVLAKRHVPSVQLGDFLCRVMELDEAIGEELSALVGELIERGLPDAARAEVVRTFSALGPIGGPEDENDLLDSLEGLRRRQAARLLRDTLSG